MSSYNIICFSEIEDCRIDSEFYKEEYLEIEKTIKKHEWYFFGDKKISTLITDGDHGNPKYSDTDIGVSYLKVEEINPTGIETDFCHKVTFDYSNKQSSKNFVEKGEVLITTVGTIGKSCVVNSNIKAILSRDIAKIKLTKVLNPYLVQIFLLTKFGKLQMEQISSGGLQQGLYISHIKKIKIPKFDEAFQTKISNDVQDAYSKYENAKNIFKEAERLLLNELGISEKNGHNNITFLKNLSDINDANRFDADFFKPYFEKIDNIVANYKGGYDFIDYFLATPLANGTTPKELNTSFSNGQPFVRSNDFRDDLLLESESMHSVSPNLIDRYSYCNVISEDILISMTGTIGETIIYDLSKKGMINQNIYRIRANNKIDNKVLALYFKVVGKILMKKYSTGNVQPYINSNNFKKIKIPKFSKLFQEKIVTKINESYKLRKESKDLLEKAKNMVEEEIEKEARK